MIELLNQALKKKLGLFIFHAHPNVTNVSMSRDDLSSADDLLPRFQLVFPDRPHGSVVFGSESVDGVILMPKATKFLDRFNVRVIENHRIRTWPTVDAPSAERLQLARQPLTATPLLRSLLARAVVAVVGLSGGGSQVVSHLAALGIGEIIGIDNQCVDRSNRLATPNLGWFEALLRISKGTAAKFRVWLTNRETTFAPVKARIPEKEALDALKRADIIVGCVNNLHARADLSDAAARYCIPYVDIGLGLIPDESAPGKLKPLVAIAGNLFTIIPGGPCLWCADFLTKAKLDDETGGRGRSYLRDGSDRDAYVSCFNGILAAEAAAEVLRLIVGLESRREFRRQYDGFTGTLLEMAIPRKPTCHVCSSVLAAGDPVWQPISQGR